MKNNILIVFILTAIISVNTVQKSDAIPNPWVDCKDNIYCGAQKAGFNFPIRVKNYTVRAMEDIMEITFPIRRKHMITVRKSLLYDGIADENGIKDISGDYNKYPINKKIRLKNGVIFNVRGVKKKFYVVNFAAETGYYSFSSREGITLRDIKKLYKLLEEAEAPRYNFDATDNYTIEQLQDIRRVDGIVEPVYTQDCFPKTLQRKGVTKNCFERANLGQDSLCSASEIKMIKEYYKKGQNKDPLNNNTEHFCAEE